MMALIACRHHTVTCMRLPLGQLPVVRSDQAACMQGLAFPTLSKQNVTPPFFSMVRGGLLDAPQFSIWLNRDISAGVFASGEILFGGVNPARFTGQMHYHPVISNG